MNKYLKMSIKVQAIKITTRYFFSQGCGVENYNDKVKLMSFT